MFKDDEVRKAIETLKEPNELFEIRVVNSNKKIFSGNFKSIDNAINELKKLKGRNDLRNPNVYIVLNQIKNDCYYREQKEKMLLNPATTKDNDIVRYKWLFIDIDPIRSSGISSTDDELNKSLDKRNDIYLFLSKMGFSEPLIALSGNGCHLLYKVDYENTEKNVEITKRFLEYLSFRFEDGYSKIDIVNHNPSRVCKLYGTLAQKGTTTSDRPFRYSKIENYEVGGTNSIELIKQVAEMMPRPETQPNNFVGENNFDLDEFLKKHYIGVKRIVGGADVKYILEECPFNSEHNNDSPAIIKRANGTLCFHCFHNSCSMNGWKEFRKHYEPNAYEYSIDPYTTKRSINYSRPFEKSLYNAKEIERVNVEKKERVITNIKELDKMLGGFTYDCVTLWASQTNGGKTTLMTRLTREFIKQGEKIFYFNGEQTKEDFINNLILLNTPKNQIHRKEYKNTGIYDLYVNNETYSDAKEFYNDKLYVYNNEAPRDVNTLIQVMEKARKELGIKNFIIDNLMQIDVEESNNQFREQERLAERLRTFAINSKSNVHLVAHSRKTNGNQIRLSLFDIAGSQNIANKSYNIVTITRIDQLDTTSNEYEKLKNDCTKEGYDIEELDSILEVLKYKYSLGRTGLVGLKYDKDLGTYIEVNKLSKETIEIRQAERERLNAPMKEKPKIKKYNY